MPAVCKRGDIPVGKGRMYMVGGDEVAVFNVAGEFHAIANACAHLGGPLSEGLLQGCRVTCPWHDWEYDVTNGKEVLQGEEAVKAYVVRVEGDDVVVDP